MSILAPVSTVYRHLPMRSQDRGPKLVFEPNTAPSLVQSSCNLAHLDPLLSQLAREIGKRSNLCFVLLSEWSYSDHLSPRQLRAAHIMAHSAERRILSAPSGLPRAPSPRHRRHPFGDEPVDRVDAHAHQPRQLMARHERLDHARRRPTGGHCGHGSELISRTTSMTTSDRKRTSRGRFRGQSSPKSSRHRDRVPAPAYPKSPVPEPILAPPGPLPPLQQPTTS